MNEICLKFSLTMSAGGSLKAVGLWRGVLPEEVAMGRPDRLVWEELVVLGKLSPSPRSSSSRGGEALVIPGWVSCSRGRDSGRGSSPSRPAIWLFGLSSAVAPLSSWPKHEGWNNNVLHYTLSMLTATGIMKPKNKTMTYNRNLHNFTEITMALWTCLKAKTIALGICHLAKQHLRGTTHNNNSHGISHERCLIKNTSSPITRMRQKRPTEMDMGTTGKTEINQWRCTIKFEITSKINHMALHKTVKSSYLCLVEK